MVSQKAAEKSSTLSDKITLVAEAVKGEIRATVNTWVASTKANDKELVFVGEGLLSITSILDPAKMQFDYSNFAYVENLYSSSFRSVCRCRAKHQKHCGFGSFRPKWR